MTRPIHHRWRLAPWLGLLGLAGPFWPPASARADDPLPTSYPVSRYQKMQAHSPFAPPTVPVAPTPAVAGGAWTDKLAVTSLMQQGGKYVAMVLDRDTEQHFLVTSDKEDEHRLMLSSVQWAPKFGDMRITIRRGTEFGQVTFDPSAGAGAAGSAAGGPGGVRQPPPIPGAGPTVFHPPPGLNSAPGTASPSSIIRRPGIGSVPPPVTAPRPVTRRLPPNGAADDDDDDN